MDIADLRGLVADAAREHRVPGVAMAVMCDGEVLDTAAGVTNVATGVAVTPDTLFQIGSISKVLTTTLVMQLVDDGTIALDSPMRAYLPELHFADPRASEAITLRQLLCHTSGLADAQDDTGRGDDCLDRYVRESCPKLPQIAAPGAVFSYGSPGFRVAGRLIEKLAGRTWDVVLNERLLLPLGMRHTVTLPEDALLYRAAVGHTRTATGDAIPVSRWQWPRSSGPSGGVISTAADLLTFARFHLRDGVTDDGKTVVSPESARAMRQEQVDVRDRSVQTGCGIGWKLFEWDGRELFGHDGSGMGQSGFLMIAPGSRVAAAVLTNVPSAGRLATELFTRVFAECAGIAVPSDRTTSDGVRVDPSRYVGIYETALTRAEVEADGERLLFSAEWAARYQSLIPAMRRIALHQVDATRFRMDADQGEGAPIFMCDFDNSDRARYLYFGNRAHPRVA